MRIDDFAFYRRVLERACMPAIEIGRICVKLNGREAGRKCIVIDVIDKNFVFVTGPFKVTGVKRRRANINHIEPTELKIDIKKGEDDEKIGETLNKAGKLDEMKAKVKPSI
jgi:large subunit ribosomal protein L14e